MLDARKKSRNMKFKRNISMALIRLRTYAFREESNKQIEDMLDNGIISPSTSPWASPIVLVRKKSGELRFCIDYRRLNQITRNDAHPLPRVDDT
jgi:hypothetical protein